jgi:hypothetical protein
VTVVFSEPVGLGQGESAPLDCVVYFEGIDFDGAPTVYPGEWHGGGEVFSERRCSRVAVADGGR